MTDVSVLPETRCGARRALTRACLRLQVHPTKRFFLLRGHDTVSRYQSNVLCFSPFTRRERQRKDRTRERAQQSKMRQKCSMVDTNIHKKLFHLILLAIQHPSGLKTRPLAQHSSRAEDKATETCNVELLQSAVPLRRRFPQPVSFPSTFTHDFLCRSLSSRRGLKCAIARVIAHLAASLILQLSRSREISVVLVRVEVAVPTSHHISQLSPCSSLELRGQTRCFPRWTHHPNCFIHTGYFKPTPNR